MLGLLLLGLPFAMAQEGMVEIAPGITTSATPDYYVIQEGDTLWEISSRFLGDPYAWPELWSVNEYITNPHWIYPGNRIYFRLGDALNPPSVSLEGGQVAKVEEAPSTVEAVRSTAEAACDFPPVFERRYADVRVSAPGIIGDKDSLNLRGEVYAADQPGRLLGEGAILHIEMKDAEELDCGALLGVYRRQGRKVKGEDGPLGHVYRVLGVAQVIRVDDDIVTARLRDGWFEIERGDVVGDPIDVDMRLDVALPSGDQDATIVARLNQFDQTLASTGETIFLDRGKDDGVDVGTTLWLAERRDAIKLGLGKEDERLPERVVGRVVVVRAEDAWSTGVVIDATRDVQVGARLVSAVNPE